MDSGEPTDINREEYGIDWEDLDRPAICRHHDTFNPENQVENENPFIVNHPDQLSHVEVPDTRCPFNDDQLHVFNTELQNLPDFSSHDEHSLRLIWIRALALASEIAWDQR